MACISAVQGRVQAGLPERKLADVNEAAASMGQDAAAEEDQQQQFKGVISKAAVLQIREHPTCKQPPSSCSSEEEYSPYPEVPDMPNAYYTFRLGHGGMPDAARVHAIAAAKAHHARFQANFLGYPCNQNMRFEEDFGSYLNMVTNNVGDTFQEGSYCLNTKFMERAVLDYYAELWHAQFPHRPDDPESYWGFCLTMGSTEGNIYAMWNARDYLSGKKIFMNSFHNNGMCAVSTPPSVIQSNCKPSHDQNAHNPIAFFSADSHYSLSKTMDMLAIRTFHAEGTKHYSGRCPLRDSKGRWPTNVPSHESGVIDVDALAQLVEFFASKGYPIIVCFNYGTTFKGAYDDVADACKKLCPILQKHNLFKRAMYSDGEDCSEFEMRTGFWFHVDGALGAAYMPYMEMAFHGGLVDKMGPAFDFRLPMVHSISMSGHKWIGAPFPCGVFMTRTKYRMVPHSTPDYIGTPDTTFAGSRNALSPMLLWDYIARTSYDDQIRKITQQLQLAAYAENCLLKLQDEVLKKDLYVARTPIALAVRFKRANDGICRKYVLSNEDLRGRRYSRIFTMGHVTHRLIDALIEDLSKPGAFHEDAKISTAHVASNGLH